MVLGVSLGQQLRTPPGPHGLWLVAKPPANRNRNEYACQDARGCSAHTAARLFDRNQTDYSLTETGVESRMQLRRSSARRLVVICMSAKEPGRRHPMS